MPRGPFLQSYIVPVCLYSEETTGTNIKALVGTAFYLNKRGLFVTAKHVLEAAIKLAGDRNLGFGIVAKRGNGLSAESEIWRDFPYEFAPTPFDIAIGLTGYQPDTPLQLVGRDVTVWQDIAAMGYPLSAVTPAGAGLWLPERVYRGYIQRVTAPDQMPFGEHPPGFELSFLLGRGSSGAPIFTIPDEVVIGVGVGSYRSEELDDEILDILEGGIEYRERRLKIEQFGYAHSLAPLLSWRPRILGGTTLVEACH